MTRGRSIADTIARRMRDDIVAFQEKQTREMLDRYFPRVELPAVFEEPESDQILALRYAWQTRRVEPQSGFLVDVVDIVPQRFTPHERHVLELRADRRRLTRRDRRVLAKAQRKARA